MESQVASIRMLVLKLMIQQINSSKVHRSHSQKKLDHDILDTEYLSSAGVLAVASTWPSNALYLYEEGRDAPYTFDLDLPPASVSVGAEGGSYTFVTGHDGWISTFAAAKGQLGNATKTMLNVSAVVYDVAVSGGAAYASTNDSQWSELHRVDISSNTETRTSNWVSGQGRIKTLPNQKYLYLADQNSSPSDIKKNRYHGKYTSHSV